MYKEELQKLGPYMIIDAGGLGYFVAGNDDKPVTDNYSKEIEAIRAAVTNIKIAQKSENKPAWYIDWE